MRRMFFYSLCLLIMASCLPHIPLSSYAATSKADEATAYTPESFGMKFAEPATTKAETPDPQQVTIWQRLIDTRFKILKRIDKNTSKLSEILPDKIHAIAVDLNIIQKEFQAISTLANMSKTYPIESTILRGFLAEMSQTVATIIVPPHTRLNSLQDDLKELLQLVQSDELTTSTKLQDTTLLDFLQQLGNTQQKMLHLQQTLNTMLMPAQKLQTEIKALEAVIETSMPVLWQTYYKKPTGRIFDLRAWQKVPDDLSNISNIFEMRRDTEIPQSTKTWTSLLIRMLVASSIFVLLHFFKRSLAARPSTSLTTSVLRIANHSLFWLCASLVFYMATWSNDGLIYYPFITVAALCLCFFQMTLAWDLYAVSYPTIPQCPMLWPLFIPPTAGLCILLLAMPAVLASCTWLIVLLLSFIFLYYHKKPSYPFTLPGFLLSGYMPFIVLMACISVLGWTRISIVLSMLYLSVGVFFQQSIGIVMFLGIIAKEMPKQGIKGILWGTLHAFLVPALLLCSMLLSILWLVPYPGSRYLLAKASFIFQIGDTTFSLLQILMLLSIFLLTRSCIHVGSSFLSTLSQQTLWFNHNLVAPIKVSFTYSLWGLFTLYALTALGFNLTNLAVVAGGLSVGIGFGLQNIINNFVSGLLVIFGQNLREDDIIEVGSVLGVVKKINVRSTTIETFDNATIFIPNAELLSGKLTNWTRNGRMVRRKIAVSVAYGTDIQQVLILLQQVADNNAEVLKCPETKVRFRDFTGNRLNFTLKIWIADIAKASQVEAQIAMDIEKTFRKNDIIIMC